MRKAILLILCLGGWAVGVSAQTCASNQWCKVDSVGYPTQGWQHMVYAPDTGLTYQPGATGGSMFVNGGPWNDAFYTYTHQTSVQSSTQHWTLTDSCGVATPTNSVRPHNMVVGTAIASGDSTVTLCYGGSACNTGMIGSLDQAGELWVEDEAIHYTICSEVLPTPTANSCPAGSQKMTFGGLTRGDRQAAGWVAATSHDVGEWANIGCPAPTGTTDEPSGRHWAGMTTYDTTRKALWAVGGYQENWGFTDTWYKCLATSSFCTALDGWHRLPLLHLGNYPNGPFPGPNNPEYVQNVVQYDAATDSLIAFGGLKGGGGTSDTFVFCLSSSSTAYIDGTHTCASAGYSQVWKAVSYHGNPGERVAPRATYDPDDQLILFYGSLDSVASYNAATGNFCMSSTASGEVNAAGCASRPAVTGQPVMGGGNGFPAWTYDTTRHRAAYYAGNNSGQTGVYHYQWSTNTWTTYTPAGMGGATPLNGPQSHQTEDWAYDSVNDTYVYYQHQGGSDPGGAGTWQLPGAALTPGPTTFTYSITIAGTGSGSVSDGAGFTCSAGTCTHNYASEATPTFTATASGGGSFAGYSSRSGDLAACTTSPCGPVSVTQTSGMTATFNPPPPVSTTRFSGVKLSGVTIQ